MWFLGRAGAVASSVTQPASVTTFANQATVRRPFLGRSHVSTMRGADDFRGYARRGGGQVGFLRRAHQSHYYPGLTEVPVDTGGGDWILAAGAWDDAGVWDDTAVWEDTA